jgi:hypothetical protein
MPLLLALTASCNPVKTGAKLGARLVGDVIEDGDVKQRGEALVGRPVSAADEALGKPIDVFKDVQGDRRWRTYPVKLDVLGHQRYVVEILADKIVSVSKAEKSGRKVDIPRALILKEKVKGKAPRECEAAIEFGRPLLAARSENTRRLVQLYDDRPRHAPLLRRAIRRERSMRRPRIRRRGRVHKEKPCCELGDELQTTACDQQP